MIAIIDYNTGNCGSIANMIRKLGGQCVITERPDEILSAERLILPGVGTFDHGMSELQRRGLIPVMEEAVFARGIPILGICLGMQLFCRSSEEGTAAGLGWIPARTVRFRPERVADPAGIRIPHMGWNHLQLQRSHPLFDDLPPSPRFYFVHSFHVECDAADGVAVARHGYEFVAAIARGRVTGVQFHPEKSHKFGMHLFRSFLRDDYTSTVER